MIKPCRGLVSLNCFMHLVLCTISENIIFRFCAEHKVHNQVYGFDQQRLIYGMFFACGIWCLADISNVNPSSEQVNAQSVSISQR